MATKNLNDLGTAMMNVFDEVKSGKMELEKAKALSKVATTVINTARVQLDYQMWKQPKNSITKKDINLIK